MVKLKARTFVSGTIIEPDGTMKHVLVCEREDGERLEEVVPAERFNFEAEAAKLVKRMAKVKPKVAPKLEREEEVEVEVE